MRPAVVVDVGWVNGLAAVRSLGRAGIRVLALDHRPSALGFRSRYAEPLLTPDPQDEEAFVDFLAALDVEGAPVFATHDEPLNAIARAADRLGGKFLYPFPRWDVLSRIQTKRGQLEAAEAAGILVPRTAYPASAAEARAAAEALGFPVLVKPSSTEGFKRRFTRQAFRCETAAEVEGAFAQAEPYEPMVQEVIPGGDDELYTLGSYLREDGEALGLFSGRKLRQTPPGVGTCRVGEALWVDEVVDQGLKLLRALSFYGLSQVELKRDRRDGAFKLMEVNPRLFQWHGLAAACGVDLPLIAYRDLTGERVEPVSANGSHKRWAITLLPGESPAPQRPPYVDAVFARDDLKPALVQVARLLAPVKLRAWLFAPALLALSRLLPASGFGLGLRLGAATLVFLIPGAFLSRALGVRGFSGALAWTMAILFGATAVTFAVHASLSLTLVLLLVAAGAAAPFAARRKGGSSVWTLWMIVAGLVAGITLWWVSGYDGDAFFHLARVQKLLALHDLSLRSVDEFKDGGLHPGYAFPLWHAAVAVIAKLAGVGAPSAFLHLPTVLLPLSFVLVYEAGTALFASRWAGVATALAEFALLGLASGHGGVYESMALPATASRTLILPALLALVFLYVREPSGARLASVAAASLAMTLVHPSYSVLVAIGLVGFLAVRALLDQRHDVKHIGAALAAIVIPAGLVVAWLLPIVRETASHSPSRVELNRAFAAYGNELDVFSRHSYRLAPELYGRAGSIAVASLLLLPLAVFAYRRMWAAFVLGSMLATFTVTLLPFVFPHFADAISLSQARRIIGFAPRPFVLVGGMLVLAGFLRLWVLPVALAAGIGLQLAFRGDFGVPYRLVDGSPGWLTWVSFGASVAALVAAAIFGRRIPQVEGLPPVAAGAVALFLLPVAVHGYSHWTRPSSARLGLPQKLVSAVRREVPRGDVVFSDPLTAYELAAFAPVYINAAPTTHVADTKANRPAARRKDALIFFRDQGPLSLARRYGAHWLLIDRARVGRVSFRLPRAYSGSRYVLYKIP